MVKRRNFDRLAQEKAVLLRRLVTVALWDKIYYCNGMFIVTVGDQNCDCYIMFCSKDVCTKRFMEFTISKTSYTVLRTWDTVIFSQNFVIVTI